MKFEKYRFRKYDPRFPALFQLEKRRLGKILGKSAEIEHIGSTAIKGLGGKGIIDILIGVKDMNKIKNKLKKNKYNITFGGNRNRIFLERDYNSKDKIRRIHLQLVRKNSRIWKNTLKVRDALRKNKKLQKEYSEIRKLGVKKAKGKGKIYRKNKKKFLDDLEK